MENKKQTPRAIEILSRGLQEYAQEAIDGDVQTIAKQMCLTPETVRAYFKGTVRNFETGKGILKALKKMILARNAEAEALTRTTAA